MDNAIRTAIEQDCIRLSMAFAYHLDHDNYQELAELFLPDGIWDRQGVELRGHQQIIAALRERPSGQLTRHVTTNQYFISIDENSATSHSYNMSYGAFGVTELPARLDMQIAILLDFTDRYVRTPQGWRFARRTTQPVLMSDTVRAMFAAQAKTK